MINYIRNDILTILKHKVKEEHTSEYILGKSTCSSIEVVYLFVVISQKYKISIELLCDSLDDYLTIDKLARIVFENGVYEVD